MPKVSIVLTTYNRASVLAGTLDSLLAQTLDDFELIISDDCSPDNTAEVARSYAERDRRVRYRRNEKNLRMPGNLNAGISEAKGEYIANVHDGDIYRADLLEKWAGALDRHPKAAFVFNQYLTHKTGDPYVYKLDIPECLDGREFLRRAFLTQWGSPVYGTVMARKACYDAVGPFDSRYCFSSDVEMWVRLALRYDVAYVSEPLIELTEREPGHLMSKHRWWEITYDVHIKRMILKALYPPRHREHRKFELRARAHYLWLLLPPLKHGRWTELRQALPVALAGRDQIPAPY